MQRQHERLFPPNFLMKAGQFFLFDSKFHLLKMKNVFLKLNKKNIILSVFLAAGE